MAKYIDAERLLAEAKNLSGPITGDGWDNLGVYALIERQPAADVRENVHGEWKYKFPNIRPVALGTVTCSICKKTRVRLVGDVLNFCPNCGADMRGDTNAG